jgi:hypothetical protein
MFSILNRQCAVNPEEFTASCDRRPADCLANESCPYGTSVGCRRKSLRPRPGIHEATSLSSKTDTTPQVSTLS